MGEAIRSQPPTLSPRTTGALSEQKNWANVLRVAAQLSLEAASRAMKNPGNLERWPAFAVNEQIRVADAEEKDVRVGRQINLNSEAALCN